MTGPVETYEYQKARSASSVPGGRTARIACPNHICVHFWPQPQLVYLRAQRPPLMFYEHMLALAA